MTCDSANTLLEPYLDEELDAPETAHIEEHLAACQRCAERHAHLLELRRGIRDHAPYFEAPAGMAERVRGQLRRAAGRDRKPWGWLAVAASVLLAISLAGNVALWRVRDQRNAEENLLSSHLRALTGNHLLDVPSSDQHTVKPWFNGKLPFSPQVKDLTSAGYPLAGGRLDYVGAQPAAALVFHRRQHLINVFVWPSDTTTSPSEFSRNGYHGIHWNESGLSYWAVSDLNWTELRQFAKLYQE